MNKRLMRIYSISVAFLIATSIGPVLSLNKDFPNNNDNGSSNIQENTSNGENVSGIIQGDASNDLSMETQTSENFEPDFVKIEVESSNMELAKLKVQFHLNEYNHISVYGYYKDDYDYKTVFFKYQHTLNNLQQENLLKLSINLPQELMYYNDQNKLQPTNYFASFLGFKATLDLVDLVDKEVVVSVHGDRQNVSFPNPWDRKHLPIYCLSWELYVQDAIRKTKIPTCQLLSGN